MEGGPTQFFGKREFGECGMSFQQQEEDGATGEKQCARREDDSAMQREVSPAGAIPFPRAKAKDIHDDDESETADDGKDGNGMQGDRIGGEGHDAVLVYAEARVAESHNREKGTMTDCAEGRKVGVDGVKAPSEDCGSGDFSEEGKKDGCMEHRSQGI